MSKIEYLIWQCDTSLYLIISVELAHLVYFIDCRAVLCITAAYAVMRCLCVCHVRGLCQNELSYPRTFFTIR